MRSYIAAFTAFTLVAALGGCSLAEDEQAGAGDWTVLSYSIADTDLEPFMLDDIAEMGVVGTQEHLNIVALVDRAEDYSSDAVLELDNWTGAKLLEVQQGQAEVLEDLGDVDTGDPDVLTNFIARGIAAYPADNYALVISDHGASWPGVGGDESSDYNTLTLEEIRSGIAAGLVEAGVDKLDLLGFDACLMATYEVASTLAPLADRMLASQELEPGHGWDYTALQFIPDNGGASVDELGAALIDGFEQQSIEQQTEAEITLSLVDLTRMADVDDALAEFSRQLIDRAAGVAPVVGRTLASTLGFGRSPDPNEDSHMADLGILAAEIGVDALDVSDAADDLVRAINDAVVDEVQGQAMAGATGLSIYFPPHPDYFAEDYREIVTRGNWIEFLTSYYGVGADIPVEQQARFIDEDVEVFFDDDGLNIAAYLDLAVESNLTQSFIRYGIAQPDGSVTFLGEEPAAVADDGSGQALGIYDLTQFVMSDGEDTASAYLELTTDEAGEVVTVNVPMAYYAPDDVEGETYQDAVLSITFDGETGDIVSETYYAYNAALGTYGELTVHPDGIISPELLNVLDDGTEEWVATSEYGLFADLPNLTYDLDDLASGTELYVELWVVDFGGNSDMRSAYIVIP